jgi:hypothetical protein
MNGEHNHVHGDLGSPVLDAKHVRQKERIDLSSMLSVHAERCAGGFAGPTPSAAQNAAITFGETVPAT